MARQPSWRPSGGILDGEDHADRRAAGGPRLDAEALGELGDEREPDPEAGAVAARLHATAVVADLDLQAVALVALGEDLHVTRLCIVHVGVDDGVGDRLGHGEGDAVGVDGPLLARIGLHLATGEADLIGLGREAASECRWRHVSLAVPLSGPVKRGMRGWARSPYTANAHKSGARPPTPVACSMAAARRRRPSSPRWRPTSCTPTGRPSGVKPAGSERAGWAVTVMREHERIHSR